MDGESESERSADRDQPHGDETRHSFGNPETRRKFLKQFTVTSAAMTLGPRLIGISSATAAEKTAETTLENAVEVHLKVNGKDYALKLDPDRKSTRLNSSHVSISYAVFCLKK